MASAREMRLRIKSVKNISQVTRALEAVSAAKVRKAIQALTATRSYASKAWQVMTHITNQPGSLNLHPLLTTRSTPTNTLVIVMTADRGLAGAYNTNIIRYVLQRFDKYHLPVKYITVGRKGRDLLLRLGKPVIADFSNLPSAPKFGTVSAIGRLVVDDFIKGEVDEVFLIYTDFVNMARQVTRVKKLLPLEMGNREGLVDDLGKQHTALTAAYEFEPDQKPEENDCHPLSSPAPRPKPERLALQRPPFCRGQHCKKKGASASAEDSTQWHLECCRSGSVHGQRCRASPKVRPRLRDER